MSSATALKLWQVLSVWQSTICKFAEVSLQNEFDVTPKTLMKDSVNQLVGDCSAFTMSVSVNNVLKWNIKFESDKFDLLALLALACSALSY